jgi:hypothetical protein
MHAPFRRLGLDLVLLALASSGSFAQGQIWIVDHAGGPGVDFTGIQPAVNAAADGDTVLVRGDWVFHEVTVAGKSLILTEDAGADAAIDRLTIQDLEAHQEVALRGLRIDTCQLLDNAGPVWLESMDIGFFSPSGPCVLTGLDWRFRIDACAAVVATRCKVKGGTGFDGLEATASTLHLFESEIFGGYPGMAGVRVTDSFLFASGCTFTGGCGWSEALCGDGMDGGPGVVWQGGPVPQLLETNLVGGEKGCALHYPFCGGCSQDGPPWVGAIELVPGFARAYSLSSPEPGGGTTSLLYQGVPGDLVFSLVALGQAPTWQPALAGSLVLPIPPLLVFHGSTDALGVLQTDVALPALPHGLGALGVYAQGAALSPVGAAVLAAPTQLTIL